MTVSFRAVAGARVAVDFEGRLLVGEAAAFLAVVLVGVRVVGATAVEVTVVIEENAIVVGGNAAWVEMGRSGRATSAASVLPAVSDNRPITTATHDRAREVRGIQ